MIEFFREKNAEEYSQDYRVIILGKCLYCLSPLYYIDLTKISHTNHFTTRWCPKCYIFFKVEERLDLKLKVVVHSARQIPITKELLKLLYESKAFKIIEKDSVKIQKIKEIVEGEELNG